jgi:hypothetical protein
MQIFIKIFNNIEININEELTCIYKKYNLINLYQIKKYVKTIKTFDKNID